MVFVRVICDLWTIILISLTIIENHRVLVNYRLQLKRKTESKNTLVNFTSERISRVKVIKIEGERIKKKLNGENAYKKVYERTRMKQNSFEKTNYDI